MGMGRYAGGCCRLLTVLDCSSWITIETTLIFIWSLAGYKIPLRQMLFYLSLYLFTY